MASTVQYNMSTTQRTHINKKYISPPPSKEAINYIVYQCCDPDPYVFGPPGSGFGTTISQKYGSGSFYRQAKIVRKTLIPTVLCLLYDFLSQKIIEMYLQKVIGRKTLPQYGTVVFFGVLKANDENSRIRIQIY